uniref:F-box domain-containing protein n=1 Tax=Opuntia streptacantha TaxID=393608 RepID=A0A7C9DGP6_OPUST
MEPALLHFLSQSFVLAFAATFVCCLLALFSVRFLSPLSKSPSRGVETSTASDSKDCSCSCNGAVLNSDSTVALANGGDEMPAMVAAAEKQTGASMMEQLVPEITTHALSYLDYPSLCRLSMTNSLMRKAANDDNAWKALYHKGTIASCNESILA